jgi:hypothetical protein
VFVLLIFGIMGLAAIVIDIGFARLAQRQMQSAVDTAALEGLRGRDRDDVSDPNTSRRMAASEFVALMFDDDLDPASGDARNFGVGPVLSLTGGVGDPSLNASQLLSVPATPVYKPQRNDGAFGLELNTANQRHGDMVAGSYDPAAAHHDEDATYQRSDFDATATEQDAFLVRMRRTNDFQGLDELDDVSSRGPAVPILFGRASLLAATDPTAGYSPRHHGVTVRATAITAERRAVSIGMASDAVTPPLTGLVPLTLTLDYWNSLTTGVGDSVTITAAGNIGDDTAPVGRFLALGGIEDMPVGLGREIPPPETPADGTHAGYVPVNAEIPASPTPRVVGFGEVEVVVSGNGTAASVTRQLSRIGPENISAVRCVATALSAAEWAEVFNHWASVDEPLLAPALVR